MVADFYSQKKLNVDEIVRVKSKHTAVVNYSLAPYTGSFGFEQRKHLLNRTMVGLCKRHLDDVENLDLQQSLDLILTPELFDEPVNNYYHQLSASDYKDLYTSDDVPPGEPFINRAYADNDSEELEQFGQERYTAIISWINQRIYKQDTSIHWKLLFFCTIWYLLAVLSWDTRLHFYTSNFYLSPVLTVIKILFMMLLSIPQC